MIIGVTGGLASGKTTVTDMFVAKGALKIDADEIAHDLLRKNEKIRREVLDTFGDEILSGGQIDRGKLAKETFSDKNNLKKLCGIMHPEIIRIIKERVGAAAKSVVIIDAPLLVEVGLHEFVDMVIVVTANRQTQLKRAIERGISKEEGISIMDNQLPLAEKAKIADYVIDNETDMEETKEGVERIWQKIQKEKPSEKN